MNSALSIKYNIESRERYIQIGMDSLSKAKDGMQVQESEMVDSIEGMGVERSSHRSYEIDLSNQFQVDVYIGTRSDKVGERQRKDERSRGIKEMVKKRLKLETEKASGERVLNMVNERSQ